MHADERGKTSQSHRLWVSIDGVLKGQSIFHTTFGLVWRFLAVCVCQRSARVSGGLCVQADRIPDATEVLPNTL